MPASPAGRCRWRSWSACGLAASALLTAGRLAGVRAIAALGVATVVWGCGVAQYPVLLPGTAVALTNAGPRYDSLVALAAWFVIVVLLIGPSFALLDTLQGRRQRHRGRSRPQTRTLPSGPPS